MVVADDGWCVFSFLFFFFFPPSSHPSSSPLPPLLLSPSVTMWGDCLGPVESVFGMVRISFRYGLIQCIIGWVVIVLLLIQFPVQFNSVSPQLSGDCLGPINSICGMVWFSVSWIHIFLGSVSIVTLALLLHLHTKKREWIGPLNC